MAKYINSEKFKIIVSVDKELIIINSGEEFESERLIPELSKYLILDEESKVKRKSNGRKA